MEHETCSEAAISSSHDRSSTEDMSGRGKLRSPCAAHDATCTAATVQESIVVH